MPALINRVTKLEQAAEANTPPVVGHSSYWAALRKVYGDHGDYSAEEMARLDKVDPMQYWYVIEAVYEREAKKKAQADESIKSG
jgi:hypothetical protein